MPQKYHKLSNGQLVGYDNKTKEFFRIRIEKQSSIKAFSAEEIAEMIPFIASVDKDFSPIEHNGEKQ